MEEGILVSKVRNREGIKDIAIVSVYNSGEWGSMEKSIRAIMEEERENYIIIGGDFNIRIGTEGGCEEEEGGEGRKSKDKTISNRGKKFIELIEEVGGFFLNGTICDDKEGEFTYVSNKGSSVIDYAIVNENYYGLVKEFKVGEKVDSDHMPLKIEEEEEYREEEEEEEKVERKTRLKIRWDKEARKMYREKTDELAWENRNGGGTVEEKWADLKRIIQGAMVKEEMRIKKREIRHKDWWDRSCTRKKREACRMYRRWRRGKVDKDKYIEERRSLRTYLEEKQKKKRKEEGEELRSLRNEKEVWKYINKRRYKRNWIRNNKSGEAWKNYFMKLLEGEEAEGGERSWNKQEEKEGARNREIRKIEEGEELEKEEIRQAVLKMKLKKAAGIDGIPMEAWRYGEETIRNGLIDILNQVWKEGSIPKDWKLSVIVPIYKKGKQEAVENYRGIAVMYTAGH